MPLCQWLAGCGSEGVPTAGRPERRRDNLTKNQEAAATINTTIGLKQSPEPASRLRSWRSLPTVILLVKVHRTRYGWSNEIWWLASSALVISLRSFRMLLYQFYYFGVNWVIGKLSYETLVSWTEKRILPILKGIPGERVTPYSLDPIAKLNWILLKLNWRWNIDIDALEMEPLYSHQSQEATNLRKQSDKTIQL